MIIVWGRIEATPEHLEDVKRLSLAHVHRSREEPGCLHHSVQFDAENACTLVFYEEWRDMASLQAHFRVPESGEFVAALSALTLAEPEMKIYEANSVG